jgi:hypothetical protein
MPCSAARRMQVGPSASSAIVRPLDADPVNFDGTLVASASETSGPPPIDSTHSRTATKAGKAAMTAPKPTRLAPRQHDERHHEIDGDDCHQGQRRRNCRAYVIGRLRVIDLGRIEGLGGACPLALQRILRPLAGNAVAPPDVRKIIYRSLPTIGPSRTARATSRGQRSNYQTLATWRCLMPLIA